MTNIDWNRVFHQQNLQIHGIHAPDLEPYIDKYGYENFREFRLSFKYSDSDFISVPLKLPAVNKSHTPYSFYNDKIQYNNEILSFTDAVVSRIPLPKEEDIWHYKGYSFPFRGTNIPYHELRINVNTTGSCPGHCLFCHRWHSHRYLPRGRYLHTPIAILAHLKKTEGEDVFNTIDRVMLITELFGNESKFLMHIKTMAAALNECGYDDQKDFNCCAHDVRSLSGLKILRALVRPARYSFSLEVFESREQLMLKYKAIRMDEVYRILERARKVGFSELQINYLAGLDSLEGCIKGFENLANAGLIDSVGLSTYTFFNENQIKLRHNKAWEPSYYENIVNSIHSLGIKFYAPESFDMGSPYAFKGII